jgi:hypothetical protein
MALFGTRRKATDPAPPKHLATPAQTHQARMDAINEARAVARAEAQARFDAEALPRYAFNPASACGCPSGCPMCELGSGR